MPHLGAQDDSKRSKVDVVADNVQFLGGWPNSPFNVYSAKGRYRWRDLECLQGGYEAFLRKTNVNCKEASVNTSKR